MIYVWVIRALVFINVVLILGLIGLMGLWFIVFLMGVV